MATVIRPVKRKSLPSAPTDLQKAIDAEYEAQREVRNAMERVYRLAISLIHDSQTDPILMEAIESLPYKTQIALAMKITEIRNTVQS
jgi:hypothetical protein